MTIPRSHLIQEVNELTEAFRTNDTFSDVHALLAEHDIAPAEVLLAGLIENGEWYECGAVVLPDGRPFFFEREDSRRPSFDRAEFVASDSLTDYFAAISVAVDMAVAGHK